MHSHYPKGLALQDLADVNEVSLILTQDCNLECDYCYNGVHHQKVMTVDVAMKALRMMMSGSIGVFPRYQVQFFGGEPFFAWRRMQEIVEGSVAMAKEYGVDVDFVAVSNGTLLTSQKIQWIASLRERGYGFHIGVSCDGLKERHDQHRKYPSGRGSFIQTLEGLKNLTRIDQPIQLHAVMSPENVDYLYGDLHTLRGKIGRLDKVVLGIQTGTTWPRDTFQKAIWTQRKLHAEGLEAEVPRMGPYPCLQAVRRVSVNPDGSIWTCHRFSDWKDNKPWYENPWCVGHVDFGITNPDRYVEMLEYPNRLYENNEVCGGCRKCMPCPVFSFEETRTLYHPPEYLCWMTMDEGVEPGCVNSSRCEGKIVEFFCRMMVALQNMLSWVRSIMTLRKTGTGSK